MLREWAPHPRLVVGMSLGGLTALRLAATEPALVPELVLVDVTPSAPERHEQMTKAQMGAVALVQGDRTFPSFAAMLDVTVAAAPHRDRKSLRRGVFHNSKRLDDGTWTWRYDSFRKCATGFEGLWDDVPAITMPTTLVRGANSFFVNDEDAEAFANARARVSSAPTSSPTPGIRCRATSRARSSTSCGECSGPKAVPSCLPIASQLIAKLS